MAPLSTLAQQLVITAIVLIAAAFCMYNRYVDGLGTLAPGNPDRYTDAARRIIEPDKIAAAARAAAALAAPAGGGAAGEAAQAVGSTQAGKMLEFAKVQGKVHAEAVKQVGELADKNPHETAAIIREWLTEAAIAAANDSPE